ncbi:unnamed protein product [Durusdinium trenchii]|uniref:Uncharacterized protein n=1 Tax=Durusdinium trenchii TaxID=1381693 RepID=A0ABP0R4E6_9DINO
MVGLSLGQGPKARNVFDTTDFDAEEKPEKRVLTKVEPTEEKTRKMAKVEPVEEKPVSAKVEPVEAPPAPTHSAEAGWIRADLDAGGRKADAESGQGRGN